VSELLTNALRHGLPGPGERRPRWPVRLGLLQPGPACCARSPTPSSNSPCQKSPALTETGRGLLVIGALADTWGYTTPSDTGKVVWAMLSTKPAPPRMNLDSPPDPRAQQHAARPGCEPFLLPNTIMR